MKEASLKQGKTYIFSNDDYTAEVSYGKTLGGGQAFKIYFNGAFVKITKTFPPVDKKINKLIEEYNLTLSLIKTETNYMEFGKPSLVHSIKLTEEEKLQFNQTKSN